MATLHLLCGVICSGKTRFAATLCRGGRAVSLSLDELSLALFGEYLGSRAEPAFGAGKAYLLGKAGELLAAGTDVVLDWGFWQRAERAAVRARFEAAGHRVKLWYLPVDEAQRLRNFAARERDIAAGAAAYHVDRNLLSARDPLFEPPAAEEQAAVVPPDAE